MGFRKLWFLVYFAPVLAGCAGGQNMFNTASRISGQEAGLFRLVLIAGLIVFLIVDGGLLYIVIRDRQRKGDTAEPKQVYENRTAEVIWTGIPVALVISLFVITITTMQAVAIPAPSAADVNVTVIGHRWWWEFDYPELGIKTANELHMPAGANVHLTLQSVDVIHSFWVPQLSGKTDVVPGQTNTMWLTSDEPGTYMGHCAEFCGIQHANMNFNVIVDSKTDFASWVSDQQQLPAPPTDALAVQGEKLVTQGVCQGCHTINGTNMKGLVGPNLTHLHSRGIFAGGVGILDDVNMKIWLANSGTLKPGNAMQNVHVTEQDIPAILAYLHTLQ
ncbi:MAG: cytochrome c oxidase subunit II [Anaerolineaceae bacterium]|nr:cytochrome c oxidase subunit II [Anaerolineaceae bacterium]